MIKKLKYLLLALLLATSGLVYGQACVDNFTSAVDIEEVENGIVAYNINAAWENLEDNPSIAILDVFGYGLTPDVQISADDEAIELSFMFAANLELCYEIVILDASFQPCFTSGIICQAALPITVASYNVERDGTAVVIQYETESEVNSDRVDIERSNDARDWTVISSIKSKNEPSSYSYADRKPEAGTNYYRLVQYDFDGRKTVATDIKSIKIEKQTSKAFPNPTRGMVDVNGIDYDLTNMPSGVYFIDGIGVVKH